MKVYRKPDANPRWSYRFESREAEAFVVDAYGLSVFADPEGYIVKRWPNDLDFYVGLDPEPAAKLAELEVQLDDLARQIHELEAERQRLEDGPIAALLREHGRPAVDVLPKVQGRSERAKKARAR